MSFNNLSYKKDKQFIGKWGTEKYYIIPDGQGQYGDPESFATHYFSVQSASSSSSISSFLKDKDVPSNLKISIKKYLKKKGFNPKTLQKTI